MDGVYIFHMKQTDIEVHIFHTKQTDIEVMQRRSFDWKMENCQVISFMLFRSYLSGFFKAGFMTKGVFET